ncbi:HAD family hydrolase [bacterium]|nr:HAD family hydrolase [bacterium]
MIKMVATDIDGTILNWDGEFSPRVVKCIQELNSKGVKVVLVTGRMHSSAVPILNKLGLLTPIVSYQGGLVKDSNNVVLYQADLAINTAKQIIKWARKNNVHLNLYLDDKLYVENDNETIKRYIKGKYVDYTVCNFDNLKIENVNKLLAIDYTDPERVTSWVQELSSNHPDLYIVKSTPYFCEIGSNGAKKSLGVEFLANIWGIKKEEILAIGDQNNDIELLKAGGVAVAMGNATRELKKYANFVTDTVEEDGFVKAINIYTGVKYV